MLTIIELLLLIIMIYRSMSRDISKRRNENKIYLGIKKNLLKPFNNIKRNIQKEQELNYCIWKMSMVYRLEH